MGKDDTGNGTGAVSLGQLEEKTAPCSGGHAQLGGAEGMEAAIDPERLGGSLEIAR
jgi:hypothetical protein